MYVLSEPGLLPGCERYILQVPDTFNTLHYYLASCGHYYTLFGYEIKRQYYEYVILCYIVSGELVVETLGRHETVRAGQCVMFDCRNPHRYYAGAKLEFLWFHVEGPKAHEICADICEGGLYVFSHDNVPAIRGLMLSYLSMLHNNQPMSTISAASDMYRLLCLCYPPKEAGAETDDRDESINLVIDFMKKHLTEEISVKDLADVASLSPYYFSRTFKTATGSSPYQYLLRLRLDRAKYLLRTTKKPVGEIAFLSGFRNTISFTKTFTESVGLAPGKYRDFPD